MTNLWAIKYETDNPFLLLPRHFSSRLYCSVLCYKHQLTTRRSAFLVFFLSNNIAIRNRTLDVLLLSFSSHDTHNAISWDNYETYLLSPLPTFRFTETDSQRNNREAKEGNDWLSRCHSNSHSLLVPITNRRRVMTYER